VYEKLSVLTVLTQKNVEKKTIFVGHQRDPAHPRIQQYVRPGWPA